MAQTLGPGAWDSTEGPLWPDGASCPGDRGRG